MSLDLYQRETFDKLASMPPVQEPEATAWDGFSRGVGLYTMQSLAKTGRAIDLLGSIGPITQDAFTGGTEAQDKYFREHDDVWGSAVQAWTPAPNEVGVAGQTVGQLVGLLPQVLASPGLAIGGMQLGTAEDLVSEGVDATRANLAGAAQGLGLGVGIWMPVLGQNLWQRVLIGGAAFNAVQGATTRAVTGRILEGTSSAEQFKAFDGQALTLDVLLGAAFGSLVHLSPEARAQGASAWETLRDWAVNFKPSDVDAIAALRQAQHMNVDSTPGKPVDPGDVEAHVERLKTAIEQLERGKAVDVSDMPAGKFEPDGARLAENKTILDDLVQSAEDIRTAEGIAEPTLEATQGITEFTTAKGSKYRVNEDGTTTRDKAPRPDHPDSGPQPPSQQTFYVTPADARILGEIQTQGAAASRAIARLEDDLAGIVYLTGKDAGKAERRSIVPIQTDPAVGLIPVELWKNGKQIHFGNEIVEVRPNAAQNTGTPRSQPPEPTAGDGSPPPSGEGGEAPAAAGFKPLTIDQPEMQALLQKMTDETSAAGTLRGAHADVASFQETIRKALAGEKLKKTEQAKVDAMIDAINQRLTAVQSMAEQVRAATERPAAKEGAEAPDPLATEAEAYVSNHPDQLVTIGTNPDGTPMQMTAKQYLEQAREATAMAREDAKLFEVAAICLMGRS